MTVRTYDSQHADTGPYARESRGYTFTWDLPTTPPWLTVRDDGAPQLVMRISYSPRSKTFSAHLQPQALDGATATYDPMQGVRFLTSAPISRYSDKHRAAFVKDAFAALDALSETPDATGGHLAALIASQPEAKAERAAVNEDVLADPRFTPFHEVVGITA